MKNNILIFSTLLLIISCDIEEGPYIADYDSYVNPEKKVLIEDYTVIFVLIALKLEEK